MTRQKRNLSAGFSYHITTRCNNREFNLARRECREVFLYAIKKSLDKYGFKLYALCIMSNHVHYLIEPATPEDLPKIMHFLNWYTAMCFNRMLNRTGHFWEARYYSCGFPPTDTKRALNTLRYIHGNPKAAQMRRSFFYDFSNYGTYDQLTVDGLTQWHPAFLELGKTLDECAKKYRGFCQRYKPKAKPAKLSYWGSKLLAGHKISRNKGKHKCSPGQLTLFALCQVSECPQVGEVLKKFVLANRAFDVSWMNEV
ncbi:MAG: transposase [Nostoc sp.]|uniref:transposase n=1 Tax=Nostoc sp. TaxID=1180 RepID=UPI002FF2E749